MHNRQRIDFYANVCFTPKADIETESIWVFLNVRFGEKKRTWSPWTGVDPGRFHLILGHLVAGIR